MYFVWFFVKFNKISWKINSTRCSRNADSQFLGIVSAKKGRKKHTAITFQKKLKAIAIQKLNIFTNRNDRQGDLSSAFLTELCHNQHLHHQLHCHHCHRHQHHHHLKLRIDILLYETLHQKLFVWYCLEIPNKKFLIFTKNWSGIAIIPKIPITPIIAIVPIFPSLPPLPSFPSFQPRSY